MTEADPQPNSSGRAVSGEFIAPLEPAIAAGGETRLSQNRLSAMETPLASIFGSGFLVIVSVLGGTVGRYSVVAMAAVCAVAYCVGSVVRFNIAAAEPMLRSPDTPRRLTLLSTLAHLALIPAYVISVALYIRILASYALGFAGLDSERNEKLLATLVIGLVLLLSLTSGLRALEVSKKWALFATVAIIVLLIGAFGIYDAGVLTRGRLILPPAPGAGLWHTVTVLAGTLIVVQGFETTRYLGGQYEAETRIRASRDAQLASSAIYVLFIACATPLMHFMAGVVQDNALMSLAAIVAGWLTVPLALVAIFSQFSAAVADAVGGSGSLVEVTRGVLTKKPTYILICLCAILLCWATTTFAILALASRAFAFYYLVQCLVAITVSRRAGERVRFGALALILAFVTAFATPVG